MKIIYTKHAEEKLQRQDFKKFKINKTLIRKIINNPYTKTKTKYGDFAVIGRVDSNHILRIIYVIINSSNKVITFHIARKGRYEN
jgi:mRNA-degrading endonuclease RelE of RelBE toxin-antitoxin system